MPDKAFTEILQRNFGLETTHLVSKDEIIEVLALRIGEMIAGSPDELFSLFYRMDIAEEKIREVFKNKDNIPQQLAELVYQRQLEKLKSRELYKFGKTEDDEWAW